MQKNGLCNFSAEYFSTFFYFYTFVISNITDRKNIEYWKNGTPLKTRLALSYGNQNYKLRFSLECKYLGLSKYL